jgi:hypothetical protein
LCATLVVGYTVSAESDGRNLALFRSHLESRTGSRNQDLGLVLDPGARVLQPYLSGSLFAVFCMSNAILVQNLPQLVCSATTRRRMRIFPQSLVPSSYLALCIPLLNCADPFTSPLQVVLVLFLAPNTYVSPHPELETLPHNLNRQRRILSLAVG